MSKDRKNVLWVNTRLTGEQVADFRRVQEHLAIRANADVVRHLVRKAAREIEREQRVPEPAA